MSSLAGDMRKREGDQALRSGDAAGAIAHYSAALEAEPLFVPALLNRAAAASREGAWSACARDCSTALAVLGVDGEEGGAAAQAMEAALQRPAKSDLVPAGGSARLRQWVGHALLRRANALCRLQDLQSGA